MAAGGVAELVVLCKFAQSLDCARIKIAKLGNKNRHIAIIYLDGTLRIVSLVDSSSYQLSLTGSCVSFEWAESNGEEDPAHFNFCVATDDGWLSLYTLLPDSSQKCKAISLFDLRILLGKTTGKADSGIKNIELIGCLPSDSVLLLLDRRSIVRLRSERGSNQWLCAYHTDLNEEIVLCTTVPSPPTVVLLHKDSTISLVQPTDGLLLRKLAACCNGRAGPCSSLLSPSGMSVSADLDYVALNYGGELHICALDSGGTERAISSFPVGLEGTAGACDSSWNRKLKAHWTHAWEPYCNVGRDRCSKRQGRSANAVVCGYSSRYPDVSSKSQVQVGCCYSMENVRLPGTCQSCSIAGCSRRVLAVCKSGSDVPAPRQQLAVCSYDVTSSSTLEIARMARDDCFIVLSHSPAIPHLVLSPDQVMALSINCLKEDLVNQVMTYKSASAADALCQLNSWDHCAVPMHALELGLNRRQLDTIAFFLKSKAAAFSPFPPSQVSSVLHSPEIHFGMEQAEPVISLLLSTVECTLSDSSSRHFGEQLLSIALDFVGSLARLTVQARRSRQRSASTTGVASDVQQLSSHGADVCTAMLAMLSKYLVLLRQHQRVAAEERSDTAERPLSPQAATTIADEDDEAEIAEWKSMATEEVVCQGILKNKIGRAQELLAVRGISDATSFRSFVEVAQRQCLAELERRNWPVACQYLWNVGIDTFKFMNRTCWYTPRKALRDFVASQLRQAGHIDKDLDEALGVALAIERLYACSSFTKACSVAQQPKPSQLMEALSSPGAAVGGAAEQAAADERLRRLPCGDLCSGSEQQSEATVVTPAAGVGLAYAQLVPAWLPSWKGKRLNHVLLDRLLYSGDVGIAQIPLEDIWEYHCRHNQAEKLLQWVSTSLGGTGVRPAFAPPLMKKRSSAFVLSTPAAYFSQPIPVDNLVALSFSATFVRESVLTELARHGVLLPSELADTASYLRRMSLARQLFVGGGQGSDMLRGWLPVMQSTSDSDDSSGGAAAVQRTNDKIRKLVEFCVAGCHWDLLFFFLYNQRMSTSDLMAFIQESSHTSKGLSASECNIVALMLSFRDLALQPTDAVNFLRAALASSRHLERKPAVTLTEQLSTNPDSYHSFGLSLYVCQAKMQTGGALPAELDVSDDLLRLVFSRHQTQFSPAFIRATVTPAPPCPMDINLYELLEKDCVIRPSRLLYWQLQALRQREGAERHLVETPRGAMVEMPYFSQPQLAADHGRDERLTYSYYLKRARPTFAFAAFVMSELLNVTSACVRQRRIAKAVQKALFLALKHYGSPHISSACAAFTEMLSTDASYLRLHATVLQILLANLSNETSAGAATGYKRPDDAIALVHRHVLQAALNTGGKEAAALLGDIEQAITASIAKLQLQSSSFDARLHWRAAILYCIVHGLPPTSAPLRQCATAGDWLAFVLLADQYPFQKRTILDAVALFEDVHLREHLQYIVETAARSGAAWDPVGSDSSPVDGQTVHSSSSSSVTRARRKKLDRDRVSQEPDTAASHVSSTTHKKQHEAAIAKQDYSHSAGASSATDVSHASSESITLDNAPNDVFALLFRCEATRHPWRALATYSVLMRNPVLAVLAGCYQDSVALDSLCCWLVASVYPPSEVAQDNRLPVPSSCLLNDSYADVRGRCDAAEAFLEIAKHCLTRGLHVVLLTGLEIFAKTVPLVHLLRFWKLAGQRCRSMPSQSSAAVPVATSAATTTTVASAAMAADVCMRELQDFKQAMTDLRKRTRPPAAATASAPAAGDVQSGLPSYADVEQLAALAVSRLLSCFELYLAVDTLHAFDKCGLSRAFSTETVSYSKVAKVCTIVMDSGLSCDPSCLVAGPAAFRKACEAVVLLLERNEQYDRARQVALLSDLSSDAVTVNELQAYLARERLLDSWKSERYRHGCWSICHEKMIRHRVSPVVAADFFLGETERCLLAAEKLVLSRVAYFWLLKDETSRKGGSSSLPGGSRAKALKKTMWHYRVQAEIERQAGKSPVSTEDRRFDELLDAYDGTSILTVLNEGDGIATLLPPSCRSVDKTALLVTEPLDAVRSFAECRPTAVPDDQGEALESILNDLLSRSRLREASELACEFCFYHRDLHLVLACIAIAQKKIDDDLLDDELAKFGVKRLQNISGMDREKGFRQRALEQLADCSTSGQKLCMRVHACYMIAEELQESYANVALQSEFSLLSHVLSSGVQRRYSLARSYVTSADLADGELAAFLSSAIVQCLRNVAVTAEPATVPNGISQPASDGASVGGHVIYSEAHFPELVRLLVDPSTLGRSLLEASAVLHTSGDDSSQGIASVLAMKAELLVRAHDCHTYACNMEGVASVLRAARACCSQLSDAELFNVMVRLLTGIGRFSEMTYVFDILKQNHQFELLFKKGIEKEDKLRLAVLDYLKRYHPDDKDTYTMVSLHFTMYREIAQLLETAARSLLDRTVASRLSDSSRVSSQLEQVVQYYADAAESYVQGGCARHAQACIRQAKLVALQVKLLHSGAIVVCLDNEAVCKFISGHNRFYESYIVADAYGKNDWVPAISQLVVANGDFKYLQDFINYVGLTPSIIDEVAQRWKTAEVGKSSQLATNLKKLLGHCKDIKLKYRIAKSFGFTEITNELLTGEASAFIKDVFAAS